MSTNLSRAATAANMIQQGNAPASEVQWLASNYPAMYRSAIVAAGKRVQNLPSTPEEAVSRGFTFQQGGETYVRYIPQAEKEKYYEQIRQGYTESETWQQENKLRDAQIAEGMKRGNEALKTIAIVRAANAVTQEQQKQLISQPKSPLEIAEQNQQFYDELYRSGKTGTFQGTSPKRQTFQQIMGEQEKNLAGLTSEEQIEFKAWQAERVNTPVKNLALFMASGVVAPVIGPTSTLTAIGLGLGVSQGVKTATVAWNKGDVWTSGLTPQELYEAGTGGIIFYGVGNAAFKGIGAIGQATGKVLPTGIKGLAIKIGGRAGVNTALGFGGGYVLSGGNVGAGLESAKWSLAFSAAGELVSPIANKFRGYKVTRLTGASEIEKVTVSDKGIIESDRLTTLQLQKENVPRSYGNFLKEYSRLFIPKDLEMGGTEKVVMRGGGEVDTFMRGTLATREAESYLKAASGKGSLSVQGVGYDNVVAQRITETTLKVPGKVYTKTTIAGLNPIGPEEILVTRKFTSTQFFGDIDRQIYLDYLKNVPKNIQQDWLMQMGGLSSTQLSRETAPTTIRVFTNIAGFQQKSFILPSIAPLTRLTPKSKVIIYPTAISQKKINVSVIPTLVASKTKTVFPSLTATKANKISAPKPLTFNVPKTTPFTIPKTVPYTSTIPKTIPLTTPQLKPFTVPQTKLVTTPISNPFMKNIPNLTFPAVSLGGGSGENRQKGFASGKWYLKKHRVKTYSEMLKTFGLGKAARTMKRIDKNVSKTLKPLQHKSKQGRRRRF